MGKAYKKYKLPSDNEYYSQINKEYYYLPENITDIPYEKLGVCMSHLVEYSSWLSRSVAYLTVNIRNAEELKKDRESNIVRHLRGSRKNVELLMRQDTEWRNLNSYIVRMMNEVTVLAAEVAALEKRLTTVSREQSRRESLLKKKIIEI